MKERRAYQRVLSHLTAWYAGSSSMQNVTARIVNLSPAGICFVSDVPEKNGQQLAVTIELPGQEEIRLMVQIVWTEQVQENYQFGAKIIDIDIESEQKLLFFYTRQQNG